MILFETTTSVFELIWDIAIALFIIRIAFFYFGLSFLTGCIIGYFRVFNVSPLDQFTHRQAALVTLPIWLVAMLIWARFLIVIYEIPRVGAFRLAIGGLALIFMLNAELVAGVLMYEEGWTAWIWETDPVVNLAGSVGFLLFGLMPLLLMGLEEEFDARRKTSHGHEKKSVAAAL